MLNFIKKTETFRKKCRSLRETCRSLQVVYFDLNLNTKFDYMVVADE